MPFWLPTPPFFNCVSCQSVDSSEDSWASHEILALELQYQMKQRKKIKRELEDTKSAEMMLFLKSACDLFPLRQT